MKQVPCLLAIYLESQNQNTTELGGEGKALGSPLFYGCGVSDDWLLRTNQGIKQSLIVVPCHFDRKRSDRFRWMMVVAVK